MKIWTAISNFSLQLRNKRRREKDNIPQEIIEEILIRLPVKSFLRFKAVSKLWHDSISSHYLHQRHLSAPCIFTMSKGYRKHIRFHLIDRKGNSIEEFQVPAWRRLEDKDDAQVKISNSCNGMFLLRIGTDIFIINPSTRYIDKVLTLDEWHSDYAEGSMSFCYDESIGDYKAVVFILHMTFETSVIVASLKEKKWTPHSVPNENYRMSPGPLLYDRPHSTIKTPYGEDSGILYFDPIKDVFENVPYPQPKSGYGDAIVGLGVLDDCLCMARAIGKNFRRGDVEVLKMKEYGVAESWTTLFVIKDLKCCFETNPLFRTADGDILISNNRKILRYNLAKKSHTKFRQAGKLKNNHLLSAITFEENLVSPRP